MEKNNLLNLIYQEIELATNKAVSLDQLLLWKNQLEKEGKKFIPGIKFLGALIEDIVKINYTPGDPCPFCGSKKASGITPSLTKEGYSLTYYFLNKFEHEMNKCSPHEMKCNDCNKIFWLALHRDKLEDDIRYKSFKNTDEFQWEKVDNSTSISYEEFLKYKQEKIVNI